MFAPLFQKADFIFMLIYILIIFSYLFSIYSKIIFKSSNKNSPFAICVEDVPAVLLSMASASCFSSSRAVQISPEIAAVIIGRGVHIQNLLLDAVRNYKFFNICRHFSKEWMKTPTQRRPVCELVSTVDVATAAN